jgi:glycosyltransferase involved in cell wall biosynthesis
MESRPRASVVIPTYERRLSVERTLQALSAQTIPADQF